MLGYQTGSFWEETQIARGARGMIAPGEGLSVDCRFN